MVAATRPQRAYDHRLREFVHRSGSDRQAVGIAIPRSTLHSWKSRAPKPVVGLNGSNKAIGEFESEVVRLNLQVRRLRCILRLLLVLLKLSGFRLESLRLPEGKSKQRLLREVDRACQIYPLRKVLGMIGLSPSRYHAWVRKSECGLTDMPSCPKSNPSQLTSNEVSTIREMITGNEYRHVPTTRLSILAQRMGKVHASATTWLRLMREHGWRRQRTRVHPPKPRVGVRATKPNEIWHVDTTLIRLVSGAKVYVHAVIDNYSRRILAWQANETYDTSTTAKLLIEAAKGFEGVVPKVFMDSGVENLNAEVDALVANGAIQRILAQVDVVFSNSMIESWWRMLKHFWLYLNMLATIDDVRKQTGFYVDQHNRVIPHSAFKGQTPDEMYFGKGSDVPSQLSDARAVAREARMTANRAVTCSKCAKSEALVQIENKPNETG
jgi:transposase InsO family protein